MALSDHLELLQASQLALATPLLFLAFFLARLAANKFASNLSSVPGPFINSFTILPRLWSVYKGSSHLEDLELHKKYGKVVRLGPKTISITDPTLIEAIYGISSKFYKGGFYEPVRFYDEEGIIPDPFVLADKPMHTRMKRNAANAYALSALVQLEPLVDTVINNLFNRLDEQYVATGQTCDISLYMLFFAMVSSHLPCRNSRTSTPRHAETKTKSQ